MKMTITSTTKVVMLKRENGGDSVNARVWEGKTERGTDVIVFIPLIRAPADQDNGELERDLEELHAKPSASAQAIPLRMVID